MKSETYSSGLVSQSFWFVEMKKLVNLVKENKTEKEIRKLCIDENWFGAAKEYRAKRIYLYLWNRVNTLEPELISLFLTSDLSTQKIINLISIMKGDRLFFEFLLEVYREKNIIGEQVLTSSDINIFFKDKEVQSEEIENWKDQTKRRLGSAYMNFMIDANLLTVTNKERIITPPILDIALERYLNASGQAAVIKAITGVN